MVNNKFDQLVVIDLEATCDEPKPRWKPEIIEIGICLLDLKTLAIKDKLGIYVKPTSTPVTEFCTKLTTITKETLDTYGVSLKDAMEILDKNYKFSKRTWASYGDFDRKLFLQECKAKEIDFPASLRSHLNIKNLLAVEYGWYKEISLNKALEDAKITFEGIHHRGEDDAYNLAKLYAGHLKMIRWIKGDTGF
jgi:inhibitor of KinA sporulation pathway (predicted exonuclease)